jgi:hypothetical protein
MECDVISLTPLLRIPTCELNGQKCSQTRLSTWCRPKVQTQLDDTVALSQANMIGGVLIKNKIVITATSGHLACAPNKSEAVVCQFRIED